MIFKLKNLHKFFFTYICPTFYGSTPPPAPSTTTQNQNVNSIPGELMPFALGNLQAAKKQLFTTDSKGKITGYQPYTPYSTDANKYVAGFSGMQTQAQQGAANLKMPGQIGAATGIAGASSLGALGAGNQYAQQATDPNSIAAYMSPYMQNVTDYQTQQANRQFDITGAQQMSAGTRAGAFGGSREALMAAENERNRNQAITGIQATGAQNAFQNAQSAQQFGANLGLQGYQTGLQGAQLLGNLGEQQLGMETGILNTQNQYGAEQQAREQALINQNIKTWENQQNQPYRAMDVMSGLIRGTPINTSSTTQTTSVANPSYAQQVGGLLGTAGSLYGAYKGKANGGIVQAYAGGGVTETVENSMEAKLRDMSPEQLRAYLPSITSQEELNIAKMILAEEVPQMATGGVVGYAQGGQLGWREQLELTQQEMKANDYRAHGWTDADIANYESSGRVPLDPKKQLALREAEPSVKMPTDKTSYYEELQANARRAPESEVIRLRDENAQRASAQPKVSPEIAPEKGITGYRPPAEESVPPKFGGNLEGPAVEGEYLGKEVPSARAQGALPRKEPIESRKMYSDETKEYKEAMKKRAEDIANGKKAPRNAGQLREDLLNAERANPSLAPKEGVAGPSPESVGAEDLWKEQAGTSNVGKNISKGITSVKGAMKDLAKGAGRVLLAPENIAMMGSDINAERFKESLEKGNKGAVSTALSAMLGSPEVVQNLLKQGTGGDLGKQFRKQNPGLAAALDEAGDTVAERYQVLKKWMTTPIVGREEKPEATGLAQTTADQFVAPEKKDLETISDMGAPQPSTGPRVGLGQTEQAQEGRVYPQEVGRVFDRQGLNANVVSSAYQPSEEPTVQQALEDDDLSEQRATAAKTPLQIMEEQNAEREKAGIKSPDQISAEQRKEIMAEKSNIGEESKRQMYLRMAEFFSNWGSTPGLPLVAGLKAMKDTIPGVMSDSKEDHAAYKAVNKSLRDLEHATELEKAGHFDKAYAIKEQASATVLKHKEKVADWAHEQQLRQIDAASREKVAGIGAGASLAGHAMTLKNRAEGSSKFNASSYSPVYTAKTKRIGEIRPLISDLEGSTSPEDKAKLKALQDEYTTLSEEAKQIEEVMLREGRGGYVTPPLSKKIESDADRAARIAASLAKTGG
jgi:hypothetical protein